MPEATVTTLAEIGRGSYGNVFAAELLPSELLPSELLPSELLPSESVGGSQPAQPLQLAMKSFRCKGSKSAASDEEQEELDFMSIATELLGTDGSSAAACPYLAPRVALLRTVGGHWLQWHVLMERASTDLQCCAFTVPMSLRIVRWLGGQVARGLVFLHGRGIVHRDLKPSNVLLAACADASALPRVWLTDWGMAMLRRSSTDDFVTTAWYRAPEIVLGLEHTAAADVWSFGVLLRRLAVGREFMSALDEPATVLDQLFQRIALPTPLEWPAMHDPQLPLADTVQALRQRESNAVFSNSVAAASAATLELLHGNRSNPYAGGNRPLGLTSAKWTARLYGTCASGRPAFSPQLSAVLQACLQPDPALRPSMQEVLRMPFFAEASALNATDSAFVAQRMELAREERELRTLSPVLARSYAISAELMPPPTLGGPVRLLQAVPPPRPVATQAALQALFGSTQDCFHSRALWIAQLCQARQRLALPSACVLYAIDFVDRVAADVQPQELSRVTCAAVNLAQIVCCDFGKVARLRRLMRALDAPPELTLAEVREACCRLLASLQYTVHGGDAEPPQKWSSWAALRALLGTDPVHRHVSSALVVLCLWPLHGTEVGVDRPQAMASSLCAKAAESHLGELLAALGNAEDFRASLEVLLHPLRLAAESPTEVSMTE